MQFDLLPKHRNSHVYSLSSISYLSQNTYYKISSRRFAWQAALSFRCRLVRRGLQHGSSQLSGSPLKTVQGMVDLTHILSLARRLSLCEHSLSNVLVIL